VCKNLHNETLSDLLSSANIRAIKCAGNEADGVCGVDGTEDKCTQTFGRNI
jgi:hypothetical protein